VVSATHPPHQWDHPEKAIFQAMQKYKKDAHKQNKYKKKLELIRID